MDTRADAPTSRQVREAHEPVVSSKRPGSDFILYGIVIGPVATAVGALVSERLHGTTRLVAWSTVTAILAVCAILLAEPGLVILGRIFRATRR
jgi:hypothetical protein